MTKCSTCNGEISGVCYCHDCYNTEYKALKKCVTQIAYLKRQLDETRVILHNKQEKIRELMEGLK